MGESLIDCVRREVKEETNLNISNIELIDTRESIFPKDFFEERHFIFFDFCTKVVSDDIILNDELQEFAWVDPHKALDMNLNSSTKEFIETFIEKKL